MAEPLRGVLIGCGYISERQLRAWRQIPEVEIVAVCDLVEEKARRRAEQFEIPHAYTDGARLLDQQQPDFVDIATRPATHLDLTRAAADRGIHVLCQKPIADTMTEAQEIVRVAEDAGVRFMVNENARHQPWFRKSKELLRIGALGEPFYAHFHNRSRGSLPTPHFTAQPYFADMPRLMVYEMGVHFLDTARYLFGEAGSVYARLQRVSPDITGEDFAHLTVGFGDLTCIVDHSWASVPEPGPDVTWGRFVVEGTDATLVLDRAGVLILYRDEDKQAWQLPEDGVFQSFVATQQHFARNLHRGDPFETDGIETLRTMELVFAAYESGKTGHVVAIRAEHS